MPDFESESPEIQPPSITAVPVTVSDVPQFSTAEYAHIPGTERCKICSNLLSSQYYRINGLMACANCAQQSQAGQPADSHVAFARGLLFGIGGAVLGLILYSTVAIVTGWTIGYVALAVGWLVGKGIQKGSHGLGGRRYQVAAVLLTYAAISLSSIPLMISYAIKDKPAKAPQGSSTANSSRNSSEDESSSTSSPKPAEKGNFGALLGQLALFGLASPFLGLFSNPASSAIGLFILFIGLRIAWNLTTARGLDVDGPYAVGAA